MLRAALSRAVRWEWADRNVAALASNPSPAGPSRAAMPDEAVTAVILPAWAVIAPGVRLARRSPRRAPGSTR
ncbi:MAG: hypothetical protein ACRDYY_14850 [Acidimicrobiales bacterium]